MFHGAFQNLKGRSSGGIQSGGLMISMATLHFGWFRAAVGCTFRP